MDAIAPIVFTARGLQADVQLKVLNKVYHVHSTTLMIHSGFFNELFLEGPEHELDSDFKHCLDSSLDPSGMLEFFYDPDLVHSPINIQDFKHDAELYITAFEKLLQAMYSDSFNIKDVTEFFAMTNMAEKLDAKEVMLAALNFDLLMCCANKLHCDILFKDTLILSLGPFHDPAYKYMAHPTLKTVAHKKYNELSAKLLAVQQVIMTYQASSKEFLDYSIAAGQKHRAGGGLSWPQYVQALVNNRYADKDIEDEIKKSLAPLLINNLVFNTGGEACSGKYMDYFLCVEVTEEDFPWKSTDTDN